MHDRHTPHVYVLHSNKKLKKVLAREIYTCVFIINYDLRCGKLEVCYIS